MAWLVIVAQVLYSWGEWAADGRRWRHVSGDVAEAVNAPRKNLEG